MPTPNATLFDPVTPNFRDLTAERTRPPRLPAGGSGYWGVPGPEVRGLEPGVDYLKRTFSYR
jgi:hypothetical protein